MSYLPTLSSDPINGRTSTLRHVAHLKAVGEDNEYYPTTDEIINAIADDAINNAHNLRSLTSIIDVGAGDGRVLTNLACRLSGEHQSDDGHIAKVSVNKLYGIENSPENIKRWDGAIEFIGSDIFNTNLAFTDAHMTFCNPPYSQYKQWAAKVIDESRSTVIYLVLPSRWRDCEQLHQLIEDKNLVSTVIKVCDFKNADRQARAVVDVIRITSQNHEKRVYYIKEPVQVNGFDFSDSKVNNKNAWDRIIDDAFPQFKDSEQHSNYKYIEEQEERIRAKFYTGMPIDEMVELYNADYERLAQGFLKINEIDVELFYELDIDIDKIKSMMRTKMRKLKRIYWSMFLNNYAPIYKRLTSENIEKIERLVLPNEYETDLMEFNAINALLITELVIKDACEYMPEQVKQFFLELADVDRIVNYKSNHRVWKGKGFRYQSADSEHSHFALDYRIIKGCPLSSIYADNFYGGILKNNVISQLKDILVIARSVNMPMTDCYLETDLRHYGYNDTLVYGRRYHAYFIDKDGQEQTLFSIKFYKNGNQHLFLDQQFTLRLNVMAGQLLGWLTSSEQAWEEMQDTLTDNKITKQDLERIYNDTQKAADFKASAIKLIGYNGL